MKKETMYGLLSGGLYGFIASYYSGFGIVWSVLSALPFISMNVISYIYFFDIIEKSRKKEVGA